MNRRADMQGVPRGGVVAAVFATLVFLFFAGNSMAADVSPSLERKAEREGTVTVIVTLDEPAASTAVLRNPTRWAAHRADMKESVNETVGEVDSDEITVVRRFDGLPQVVVEVTPEGLAELAEQPDVESISPLTLDEPLLHQSAIEVQARAFNQLGFIGTDWAVAVIDTGVPAAHPFLAGKVVSGACYTNFSGGGPAGNGGLNGCPNGTGVQVGGPAGEPCTFIAAGSSTDQCRHGVHVAGIVAGGPNDNNPSTGLTLAGMAPGAKIAPYQVFTVLTTTMGCGASNPTPCLRSYNTDQLAALESIRDRVLAGEKIAAVNMSLGGGEHTTPCTGGTEVRRPVIIQLRNLGVAVVIASGNESSSTYINAPGCIPEAVTVGSTVKGGAGTTVSGFSNHTSLVDLMAPGSAIRSSLLDGAYGNLSGTSMAAPHVAGVWAAMKQKYPNASVSLIERAFQETGPSAIRNDVAVPVIRVTSAATWLDNNPCYSGLPTPSGAPTATASLVPASPGPGGDYTTGSVTVNVNTAAGTDGPPPRCIEWRWGSSGPFTTHAGAQLSLEATNGTATPNAFQLQYRVVDWATNASPVQSVFFTVRDGVAPTTTHTLNPMNPNGANGWYTGSPPQVTLAAADNFAPANQLTIAYRLGTTGDFIPYTGPFAVPANSESAVVQYRATDPAGNVEATKQFTVKTDSIAPSSTSQVSAAQVTHPATIEVTLTATDATSGVATTTYCVTTGATCTPSTTYTGPFNLSGIGNYTVAFRSTDAAGNVEPNRTATARIADPTPPISSHQVSPDPPDGNGGWYRSVPQVTLLSADAITPPNELQIEYRVGGNGDFAPYTAPFGVEGQGDGILVEYRATDGDGNLEPIKSFELDIDSVAPETTASAEPPQIPFPGTVLVALDATDAVSGAAGSFYCVTLNPTCAPSTPYTTPFAIWGMGVHTVRFRSIDAAGNLETTKQIFVDIEVVPLTVEFGDLPSQVTYGDEFTVAALVLGGTPAEVTAGGACAVTGDSTSPVTVHVVAAGECQLTAGGAGVAIPEFTTITAGRATTSTTLKVKPRKLRSGKKARLRAVVRVPGGRASEGKVEFRVRGKRKTARVNSKGVAVVKVKLTGKPGRKFVVRARHLGSSNLIASPRAKFTIRLR